jgi:branched-chain amino acid transport system ATP-binding protein
LLTVTDLRVAHGAVEVLHGLGFLVNEGEIVAFIGANGAGKSTMLGAIAGIHRPAGGQVVFRGRDVSGLPAENLVRQGIVLVPERRQVFAALSVYDNLLLGAYHRYRTERRVLPAEINKILEKFAILKGREKQAAGTLSGGMQQMLVIGRAMMAKPKLLLLDEPSLGLAPLIVGEITQLVRSLRDQGMTIVVVEQNVRAALQMADRGYVLERGQLVMEGTAEELMVDCRVQNAYLGRRREKESAG